MFLKNDKNPIQKWRFKSLWIWLNNDQNTNWNINILIILNLFYIFIFTVIIVTSIDNDDIVMINHKNGFFKIQIFEIKIVNISVWYWLVLSSSKQSEFDHWFWSNSKSNDKIVLYRIDLFLIKFDLILIRIDLILIKRLKKVD